MAILKNEKAAIKQFVQVALIDDDGAFPDFETVEERYLVPLIGDALYDQVTTLAAETDPAPETPTAEQKRSMDLLKRCRAVVAPLAYYVFLPTIQTQITDGGLRNITSSSMPSAHKWEYREMREHLAEQGAYAIEALLKFLFKEKASFTAWTESPEYKEVASLVFTSGTDFKTYFSALQQPHRLFWELRPLIREVEDFYVASILGAEFFKSLKEKANKTDADLAALELVKKGVAQATIMKAVEKLSVKLTPSGFTVLLSAGDADAANSGDVAANSQALRLLYDSCQRDSDAYFLQLQEYMNKTASATVFTNFFTSPCYKAPATEEPISRNANRKIFGL